MLIELAIRNLARNRVRSVLAIIGIIIGVMAISSIGIFSESLKAVVLENFKDVANEVVITPAYTHGWMSIDKRTVEKIKSIPYATVVIPIKSESEIVEYEDKKTFITIYGIEEKDVRELFKLKKGYYRDCIAGGSISEFFKLKVGDKITIRDKEFRIGGILIKEARFDINPNFAVILPIKDFDKLFDKEYSIVIVKLESMDRIEDFKKSVDKTINRREKRVSVFEIRTIIEAIEKAFRNITLFLMAIAGVSLLVAGVSILNIMLMSTIERTREIGLMRAIGAYKNTILRLFLIEALVLGIVGSIIGGLLGFLGGYAIDMLILKTAKYVFQPASIVYVFIGLFFGILTALISALYPAWKASKLEPIDALRYE